MPKLESGVYLLPCAPNVCQECAVDHEPEQAHNAQSLYYQYKFYGEHGRWPTWEDAIAHCSDKLRTFWIAELTKAGQWPPKSTEPQGRPQEPETKRRRRVAKT